MGPGRMGDVSDIGFHTLAAISDNFIRPETLKEANDRVSNAIAKLPIFRQYDLGDAPPLQQRRPEIRDPAPHDQRPPLAEVLRPTQGRRVLHAGGQPYPRQRHDHRRKRA